MKKMGLNQLRSMFQDFYKSKDHYPRKSFSLVPENDKSLLIINSGMAPLKPYFAGLETPPSKRMTTCQKCIRTGDIDNVGHTSRHGTFFEMLGSFSFGDYFKKESLTWGWEFITSVLKMPTDKLWATVYEEDDQAYEIWKEIGMPEDRIVRLGKDDNFWEIGLGPCGPCSEIYFDRGEKYGCGSDDCKPGCECDRYVEFWNHVFTQFNKGEDGSYTPLAHPNIDTGMGLERLACIMQDVDSIFAVDTIKFILDKVVDICKVSYSNGEKTTDISLRIITDHIRSVTFMIADGIIPSNEGRGYVLRRLLRRAARHGRILGIKKAFLADLSDYVIEISGEAYPELISKKDYIKKILRIEEDKFETTIDQGTEILNNEIGFLAKNNSFMLSGDIAFKLYDTYGFPIELTKEISEEKGYSVDEAGFKELMEKQKETARSARKSDEDEGWKDEAGLYISYPETVFSGYKNNSDIGKVIGIFAEGAEVCSASEGQTCKIILDKTPFYAESGGQIFDTGYITTENTKVFVFSVQKTKNNVFLHSCKVISGVIEKEDNVSMKIDIHNRNNTARNHTATHILHKALRDVLGEHVEQAGSSVNYKALRFDFTHFEPLTTDQLIEVEKKVNSTINDFLPVYTRVMSIDEARKTGAAALFGEKYGDKVRVVNVGEYSIELCGGTHVSNSGEIGAFHITSENGIAAGVRRIEAITGAGIYNKLVEDVHLISDASSSLKTVPGTLNSKIYSLLEENKNLKKELDSLKKDAISNDLENMLSSVETIKNIKILLKEFKDLEINDLRSVSDKIKETEKNIIMVFACVNNDKVTLLVSITDDLTEKGYHAGKMIKEIARACGGGGGGKADMAQAGGKDPSKITDAFDIARSLI